MPAAKATGLLNHAGLTEYGKWIISGMFLILVGLIGYFGQSIVANVKDVHKDVHDHEALAGHPVAAEQILGIKEAVADVKKDIDKIDGKVEDLEDTVNRRLTEQSVMLVQIKDKLDRM